MGAREATSENRRTKAKGPAEAATSPSHGSTHRGTKDMNEGTDTTTPIEGTSVRSWSLKVGGLECALRTVHYLAGLAFEIGINDLRVEKGADGKETHILPAKSSDQITALLNAIEEVSLRELGAVR